MTLAALLFSIQWYIIYSLLFYYQNHKIKLTTTTKNTPKKLTKKNPKTNQTKTKKQKKTKQNKKQKTKQNKNKDIVQNGAWG